MSNEAGQTWHGIPDDAIILGEIRIVNYLNPEGSARFGYSIYPYWIPHNLVVARIAAWMEGTLR